MNDPSEIMPFALAVVRWLFAFLFTQAIEVPIYRKTLRCGYDVAFGASAITHPIVWFLIPGIGQNLLRLSRPEMNIFAELFTWLVETAYFAILLRRHRVAGWTLLANSASYTSGLIAYRLLMAL